MTRPLPASRLARLALPGLLAIAATPAAADQVIADDAIIQGNLCAGSDCINGQSFPSGPLLLSQPNVRIRIDDTSGADYPADDWQLIFNSSNSIVAGGINKFTLRNITQGVNPFTIEGNAPASSLYVAEHGFVGIGTSLPASELHIASALEPTILLEQTTASGNPAQSWLLEGDDDSFRVTEGGFPTATRIRVRPGHTTMLDLGEHLGVGTLAPEARLHVEYDHFGNESVLFVDGTDSAAAPRAFAHFRGDNGYTKLLIEELANGTTPRTLLNLLNNGRPEIVMANTATNGEWSFGAGTKFVLKQGFVGTASSDKTKLFEIDDSGNATFTGSLTTGGTTCGAGCDAVFDAGYELPSIADHAAQMYRLGHLPNMGPMVEGQPFNLTNKFGRLLNEVEHAHIYIAQLEGDTRRIPALEAENAALAARLERLEATVAALTAD